MLKACQVAENGLKSTLSAYTMLLPTVKYINRKLALGDSLLASYFTYLDVFGGPIYIFFQAKRRLDEQC